MINPNASHVFVPDQSSTRLEETSEINQLKSRNFFLENSNVKISQSYQYAIEELEERAQSIGSLKSEIKNLTAELKKAYDENDKVVQVKVKAFKEEKRVLQVKHESSCAEVKSLKTERDDLKKDLNASSVAIKSIEKENKETNKKLRKQVDLLEMKIKDLEEYKAAKVAEERELKSKIKKTDKKWKSVLEREAKISINKKNISQTVDNKDDDQNNVISIPLSLNPISLTSTSSLGPSSLDPSNSDLNTTTMESTTLDPFRLDQNTMTPSSLDYTSLKYPVLEASTASPDSTVKNTTTSKSSTTILTTTPDCSNSEQQTRSTLPIDDLEAMIRRKAKLIVNRKLDGLEIDEEAFTTLEKELLDDLEDTVLEQIELYRNNLSTNQAREDEHAEDVYEMQGFYWGGEDC